VSKLKFVDRPTVQFALEMARDFIRAAVWLLVSFAFSYGRDLLVETGRPPWMVAVATCVEIFSFVVGAFVLCCLLFFSAAMTVLPMYRKLRKALEHNRPRQGDLGLGGVKKK
jgi:hypothetical protein